MTFIALIHYYLGDAFNTQISDHLLSYSHTEQNFYYYYYYIQYKNYLN